MTDVDLPPVLEAEGMRLRPWSEADAADVLRLAQDPVTKQWSPSLFPVNDLAAAREWIRQRQTGSRIDWAACDAATGEIQARIGLHHFDGDVSAEIGYGVWPAHRGRGVASRAVQAATDYGFGPRGLARIGLIHAVGNRASCAVACSSGYAFEGLERALIDHGDGLFHDAHRHGRLATDPAGRLPLATQPIEPAEVNAGRWRLVPWRDDDLDEVASALAEPHIVAWNPKLPLADKEAAVRWIAGRRLGWVRGDMAGWAVRDATDGALVGSVTLRDIGHSAALVAYWVRAAHLGRGVAPAAVEAAVRYAFDDLGIHRLELYHALANDASCRVAEKTGFALEGTTRGSDRLASGSVDEHLHARLVTD